LIYPKVFIALCREHKEYLSNLNAERPESTTEAQLIEQEQMDTNDLTCPSENSLIPSTTQTSIIVNFPFICRIMLKF
jgi:hypothetical protein